ncbi:MAG TPA: dipeptidase [Vicinamibacterales bacterium]|nr:dipeptidase [Vicinamibacterales bacterium]
MRPSLALLCAAAMVALFMTSNDLSARQDLLARAKALHAQVPLIDGHNDYPWALRGLDPGRDFATADITKSAPALMTDIPRLRAGGVGGQFWSVYVPSTLPAPEAVTATLEQIDVVHRMMKRWPETFELALTADDVERVFKKGRIASMIGMEGGHSIASSLATLRMMYALGARYMTLTHNNNTPWADAAADQPEHGGLTTFGEEVVHEMNWLGMLVDLSHVSPDTMDDALRVAAAPVIFSHSSARAIADVPRNVPDAILRQMPMNGGVVMVSFVPGFTSPEVVAYDQRSGAERTRLQQATPNDEAAVNRAMDAWRKANPAPRATIAQVADHVDHIRQVAGIDHIGLGGDFDGITDVVQGLEDVSTYPALTAELLKRGYSDNDVKKVIGLNVLRAMRQAERVSADLRKQRGPSTATLTGLDGAQ